MIIKGFIVVFMWCVVVPCQKLCAFCGVGFENLLGVNTGVLKLHIVTCVFIFLVMFATAVCTIYVETNGPGYLFLGYARLSISLVYYKLDLLIQR